MDDAYSNPETLVSTEWVAEHSGDPSVVVAEVNADLEAEYRTGHVPGAVGWGLHTDLEDLVRRDIPGMAQLEDLLGRSGIDNETTVVLYGDGNNRSATWAFWVLKYYRHEDVRIMNGGRRKWLDEGRAVSTETPTPTPRKYGAAVPDRSLRAMKEQILAGLGGDSFKPLDTRTYEEYAGQLTSAPGTPRSDIHRKGRIPRRGPCPVGRWRGRGRHLQVGGRAAADVRGKGARPLGRDRPLLSPWRQGIL